MKTLKLLATVTLFSVTFGNFQGGWGAETTTSGSVTSVPTVAPSLHTSHQGKSFSESPFYHPYAVELYRASVQTLRQDIIRMQDQRSSSEANTQVSAVQQEIREIEAKLALQREALEKYGKNQDRDLTKQKIQKEIEELKRLKETAQQSMVSKPTLKKMYEEQLQDVNARLESYAKYLPVLDESEVNLQANLEGARKYLKKLEQESSSSEYIHETMSQKIKELKALYKGHTNGLCSREVFSDTLPKTVLESLGIPSLQVNNMDTARLFQFFARTMELPYFTVPTGGDKDTVYRQQLKVVVQNLMNRLSEDVFTFQMISSIAQSGKISVPVGGQHSLLEMLMENPKLLEVSSGETMARDLGIFKGILAIYGYQEEKPSQLLEDFIRQSPYGLLGICIRALEYHPITSWNDIEKIGLQARMRGVKTPEAFSVGVVENVYSILGRHINILILQKIDQMLSGDPVKPTPTSAVSGFYI